MARDIEVYKDVDTTVDFLISSMENYRIFLLSGELGAGKTYLVQHWMKALGVTDRISSPTFSLVNNYVTSDELKIYHMDMYRLKSLDEAMGIGFMEMIDDPKAICIIEWPELIMPLIDHDYVDIKIEVDGDGRRYKLETFEPQS